MEITLIREVIRPTRRGKSRRVIKLTSGNFLATDRKGKSDENEITGWLFTRLIRSHEFSRRFVADSFHRISESRHAREEFACVKI